MMERFLMSKTTEGRVGAEASGAEREGGKGREGKRKGRSRGIRDGREELGSNYSSPCLNPS